MHAVSATLPSGPPATTVVRLSAEEIAAKTGVAATGRQPRPIAAILPQVLARYGLSQIAQSSDSQPRQLDLFA